ncbi:ABC transporter substrate-binding protein [Paenibacillus senegalensis]|uniref:ABC transporter substrate-binding protein n=1 Tax=Paenibacillus senegalensis TaxID=1465766 RepID=UPI000287EC8B|nr:extracellular solute-binding protein [Paenibacillus senegalensis]
MKKIGLFSLICMMVFVLAACSNNTDGEAESSENEKAAGSQHQTDKRTDAGKQTDTQTDTEPSSSKTENGKTVITFATFYENDLFKEAKRKYEAKHPNIEIQLTSQHASGMDANWDNWETIHEQFVKTTNTQMLAGSGPDVLELDELPIGQYVNQKVLVNVGELMENDPDFHKDQYFVNILDNFKLNDGTYAIPLQFYLNGFTGVQEDIEQTSVSFNDQSWTWEQFIQVSKEMINKGDKKHAFEAPTPGGLLNNLVQGRYSEFVDEANRKANFDSAAFIGLMKQVQQMLDQGIITTEGGGADSTYFRDEILLSISDYLRKQNSSYGEKFYIMPHAEEQKAGGHFQALNMIGINAHSPVKEEAWDFVKFLMSEELGQSTDTLMDTGNQTGFPLNRNVYQKQAQNLLQIGKMNDYEGREFTITEKDLQSLESYLTAAVHPIEYKFTLIQEIIYEESEAFFAGQKSAEDVAKLIQNRVTTYLNE